MFSIKLDEIPEEGLNLTWEEPRDSLGAYIRTLSSVDFEFETPLAGEARIERIGQAYLVRGKVQARLRLSCVRCLKEFEYPILSPFQISLHPVQEGGFEEEVELAEEDMESAFFEGGELHLSEIACEQVFLEIPYQPLCGEGCKGLCPKCGRDLNASSCDCVQDDWKTGFSALRHVKIDPS